MLLAIEGEINCLFDRVPFGSFDENADGTIRSINALQLAWLGHSRDALIGKRKFCDFLTPQSRDIYRRYFSGEGSESSMLDLPLEPLEIVLRDGSCMPISLSVMRDSQAATPWLKQRFMVLDMSETRRQISRQNISAAVFESPCGTFITDHEGNIQQVNDAFMAITGYSAGEAIGRTPRMLSSGHHDKPFYAMMWNAIKADGRWQGEIWDRRKDGEVYVEWLSICAVLDATGAVTNYVGSFIDITASKNAQDELSHMAYHDALTQLPNRRLFLDRLSQAISASRRSKLFNAIFFIDLDNFKTVNDTGGHDIGDLLLVEVARRLRHAVRAGDSVARLSGDEFGILLEDLGDQRLASADKARHLGEKVLAVLSQTYTIGQRAFHCSACIGIQLFQDENTASELLQHADLAMYQAKHAGKDCLRFFDQAMQASVTARGNLEAELHEAVAQRQFRLHFQPQVNRQGEILGAEALLRWEHPRQGLLSPAVFVPLAEETRLILPIGSWVLQTACAQLKVWAQDPIARTLQLAVNVSALQFQQEDFVPQLTALIAASEIDPRRLKLEVTESMVLDMETTVAKMTALQKCGVNFSMDDFGTGYSSLSALTRLPIEQLKIDQSFVHNIGQGVADGAIVQTIIAMAHTLDLDVIAEGVETEAQRSFLDANGCQHYQGYLFGRPVPIGEFEKLL